MQIIDAHVHWRSRPFYEMLCDRPGYPKVERDDKGGYRYFRRAGLRTNNPSAAWFDLDAQFEHMDLLGRGPIDIISSLGPFSAYFSELPVAEGRELATAWNEEVSDMQRKRDRFWATAAVPLVDTSTAIDVLDHAVLKLGLVGVDLPGGIGSDPHIDAERLEPFYDRVEELNVPLFIHPTDVVFFDAFAHDYGGALHLSLGRIVEVSSTVARLIFSGIMERHPELKVMMTHAGGALPYQAGRLDKNGRGARLAELPSVYLKRIYTDIVSPHELGMKWAIEFFGVDHILYGSDYPCWAPSEALRLLGGLGLSTEDREKVMGGNARQLFSIRERVRA